MKKVILEPLKIRRLSEIVETHIRDLITSGEIKVGERLPTEKELCRQFGVSAVTAREALKGLEVLGLIEKKKGKGGGIFVTQMNSDSGKIPFFSFLNSRKISSEQLNEFRMIVEPSAARAAARLITGRETKELYQNIRHCKQMLAKTGEALSAKDSLYVKTKNFEFHKVIAEATRNPIVALTVSYTLDYLESYKRNVLVPSLAFTMASLEDHEAILSELEKRSPEGAEKEMIDHIRTVMEYIAREDNIKD